MLKNSSNHLNAMGFGGVDVLQNALSFFIKKFYIGRERDFVRILPRQAGQNVALCSKIFFVMLIGSFAIKQM